MNKKTKKKRRNKMSGELKISTVPLPEKPIPICIQVVFKGPLADSQKVIGAIKNSVMGGVIIEGMPVTKKLGSINRRTGSVKIGTQPLPEIPWSRVIFKGSIADYNRAIRTIKEIYKSDLVMISTVPLPEIPKRKK